jgi:O-antigen biosynthesis protein
VSAMRFPAVDEPRVTVVVVGFGGLDVLREALDALRANTPPCYELVVVDNASPDGTTAWLRANVGGAQVLFNTDNIGFARASNQGAEAGVAPFVCFLNSDAIVQKGWLEPLLEAAEADATVGAVVPLLLNEDGTVQEAGSIVDAEGFAFATGAGESADALAHRFRRDVDFGSAACLLTSRTAFFDVEGFDPDYGVGYYEDVDLCFKLRRLGLRTVYEPNSRVVHLRHGSSTPGSARALMHQNRITFLDRWGSRLAERPNVFDLSGDPRRIVAARDAEALDRILVIEDRVPHVDRGSGDPRMAKLLLELAALWPEMRITLAAVDPRRAREYSTQLLEAGIEVVAAPDWQRWLEDRRFHYSAVLVSRTTNAERFRELLQKTQPQALRVFDLEALSFRRLERLAQVSDGDDAEAALAEAGRTREAEIEAIREADVVFSVSEDEAAFVQQAAAGVPTFVLPSFVEPVDTPPGHEQRKDLIFFGGFLGGPGTPNEDALLHLVAHVMPLVWREEPELVLHVIGADPTPAVAETSGPRINVVGYVADPLEWLLRARVHVHPMRFGAGIKLKLLETMAAGLPFITTRVGAEGLGVARAHPLLVTDEPEELARRTLLLYREQSAWEAAQQALLELARARFSRDRFRATLAAGLAHAGIAAPAGIPAAEPNVVAS